MDKYMIKAESCAHPERENKGSKLQRAFVVGNGWVLRVQLVLCCDSSTSCSVVK